MPIQLNPVRNVQGLNGQPLGPTPPQGLMPALDPAFTFTKRTDAIKTLFCPSQLCLKVILFGNGMRSIRNAVPVYLPVDRLG